MLRGVIYGEVAFTNARIYGGSKVGNGAVHPLADSRTIRRRSVRVGGAGI